VDLVRIVKRGDAPSNSHHIPGAPLPQRRPWSSPGSNDLTERRLTADLRDGRIDLWLITPAIEHIDLSALARHAVYQLKVIATDCRSLLRSGHC
jgi:hypothetical protein